MRLLLRNADIVFVSLFVLGLAIVLAFLPNPTGLDDSLRHLAMGKMMLEKGVLHSYWSSLLFWGTMSALRTDPWFLYDAFMAQLARLPDLVALDVGVWMSVSALAFAGFIAIRSIGLKGLSAMMFLWLLLMGDQQFFARMMIGRPFTLQTALMIGIIACIWSRRYALQAVLMALSVLVSQLFIFPLVFSIIGIVWAGFARSLRDSFLITFATVIGTVAGFALHPYPEQYVRYLATVFLQIPFLIDHVQLSKEMHMSFGDISMTSVLIATGAIVLLLTHALRMKKHRSVFAKSAACYLSVLSALLIPIYVIWVRAIDLAWPLLVFAIAALFMIVRKDATKMIGRLFKNRTAIAIVAALMIFQTIALPTWFFIFDDTRRLDDYSAITVIPNHARVLNLDWTQFPELSLLQPHARYATGIDPSFLYLTDPRMYQSLAKLQDDSLTDEQLTSRLRYAMRESNACIIALPMSWPLRLRSVIERMPHVKVIAGSRALILYQIHACQD